MSDQLKTLFSGYENKYPRQLAEKFPRIVEKIVSIWNSPEEMSTYLQELLVADRHDRQGFPAAIASELLSLNNIYDEIQRLNNTSNDVWEHEASEAKAELERQGVAVNARSLILASERKNIETLRLLLKAGLNPDIRDDKDWTPLMIAAFEGDEAIALLLIQQGATINVCDRGGYSPLHWASFSGFESVVKLLLSKGADPNIHSHHSVTPLLQASARGHLTVVKALLASGARANESTDDGWTALHKAIANGHKAVVEALLENGSDLLASHNGGATPFQLAQKCQYPEIREIIKSWVVKTTAGRTATENAKAA